MRIVYSSTYEEESVFHTTQRGSLPEAMYRMTGSLSPPRRMVSLTVVSGVATKMTETERGTLTLQSFHIRIDDHELEGMAVCMV